MDYEDRELTPSEIALINEVEKMGGKLRALCKKVEQYHTKSLEDPIKNVLVQSAESYRWLAMAKTDLQTGLMALTRAVAKPEFF